MNRIKTTTSILILTYTLSSHAENGNGELMLKITGLKNEQGQVVANLFCEGMDVMQIENSCRRLQSTINGKQAELVFHNLPYGTYAVSLFHDENNNGTLDHNFLHLPAEALGFSNGFKLSLFSGLPSFEKLQFTMEQQAMEIDIELN